MAPVDGAADPVAGAIHQAASAHFKNFVEKHWETYDEAVKCLISDADKAAIRGAIVEAIVAAPDAVRKQLLTAIRRMIRSDFPKAWPGLLESVAGLLQSSENVRRITAGLGVVQEMVAWRGHNQQEVFDVIQGQVFPVLLQIGQHFITKTGGDESYGIIKSVLKAYFSAIQFKFSHWLLSGEPFMAWFNFCVSVIQVPVPAQLMGLDKGAASETPFWKMKKWAFHIQNKIMLRYGNTKCNSYANPEAPGFAKAYMQDMGVPVVQLYLGQVQSMLEGKNPLTDRIVCIMCDFFEAAIRHKRTWAVFEEGQVVLGLVEHFVFPQLCWSEADATVWEEDPHEFVRTRLDPFDDFYSASAACINFVVDLIKTRKKATFMPILGFLNRVLGEAQARPEDPVQQSRKDGAMYLVGSLSTLLMDSKVAGQMESFLATFVLPELTSGVAHLRLRACWVVEQFDGLEYAEQASAMAVLSGILACLGDAEFPVRVAASSGLAGILENDFVRTALPPYLPKVIEAVLALANEIELDSLSYVLEDLVGAFSEEMAPYAAQLCVQLRDTLMRSLETYGANAGTVEDDDGPSGGFFDDTDKMMAVIGMLGTINSLLDSMAGKPETMAQMEGILLPLIYTVLQGKVVDVYEEVFSLLDSLTFAQKAISEDLWALLEQALYPVFLEAGSSYIADMASTLDNYISYGTQALLGPHRKALGILVEMIHVCMTEDDYVESDWVHGCQLMESLLLNCRGAVDEVVPGFIRLVVAKLTPTEEDKQGQVHAISHCVLHVEAILNALYYNPMLTLGELEGLGATSMVLTRWLDVAAKFTRVHDKRLLIMAISALLSALPVSQMPASLQAQWPAILGLYLEAVQSLPKAIEERRKLKEAEERSDDEDDNRDGHVLTDDEEFADGGDDDDEGVPAGRHFGDDDIYDEYDGEEDDDEDDWEEDELEEEIYFETPLDNVDIQSVVAGTVKSLAASQAGLLSEASKALSPDHQAVLSVILASH
jgi:hypothetical protein